MDGTEVVLRPVQRWGGIHHGTASSRKRFSHQIALLALGDGLRADSNFSGQESAFCSSRGPFGIHAHNTFLGGRFFYAQFLISYPYAICKFPRVTILFNLTTPEMLQR